MKVEVYLGLGSNLGHLTKNIEQACALIEQRVGTVVRRSSDYVSEPWGFESANLFLNCAICVETDLAPLDLLHETQRIEREMGRTEKSENGVYHDRIIDIDILLYEGVRMQTPELTIPHPLIDERPFVYEPLKEISKK